MLVLNIFLIFPISGYIIYGITWLFEHITTGHAAPFGDFILTFAFLFLLILGLQTSLIPIYIALLASAPLNLNTIFPLLGMAGPGQVGAALALMITSSKKSNFRKTTLPSLISGVLGIDEPLLYGMNLPRIAPLFTSALAAGCAGFFIGGMQDWVGINMGVQSVYGVNGIWGIFTVTSEKGANIYWPKVVYCAGFMISIILGFVFTKIGYHIFKNNKKINWDLN